VSEPKSQHFGFKTSGLVIGGLFLIIWTLAFMLGQAVPAMITGEPISAEVWTLFLTVTLIIAILTIVIYILHVVYKLVYAGEEFIQKSS
jgi:hypothetical protein